MPRKRQAHDDDGGGGDGGTNCNDPTEPASKSTKTRKLEPAGKLSEATDTSEMGYLPDGASDLGASSPSDHDDPPAESGERTEDEPPRLLWNQCLRPGCVDPASLFCSGCSNLDYDPDRKPQYRSRVSGTDSGANVGYCSKACQKEDWNYHKILCTTFRNYQKRPGKHFSRGILFPVDEDKPRWIWMYDDAAHPNVKKSLRNAGLHSILHSDPLNSSISRCSSTSPPGCTDVVYAAADAELEASVNRSFQKTAEMCGDTSYFYGVLIAHDKGKVQGGRNRRPKDLDMIHWHDLWFF